MNNKLEVKDIGKYNYYYNNDDLMNEEDNFV